MADDFPVIQAVYKFIQQLGGFFPISVINRFHHGIFNHKIISAYTTVIPGDIFIKGDIAVCRMQPSRISQGLHTFVISSPQIFQPRKGPADPGNNRTAKFLFKKSSQAAMYLLRPLLKLLVGIRPDNQKYLPVHTERKTYQLFPYPFRYFPGHRHAQSLCFQLTFLICFALQHTHNGQQAVHTVIGKYPPFFQINKSIFPHIIINIRGPLQKLLRIEQIAVFPVRDAVRLNQQPYFI